MGRHMEHAGINHCRENCNSITDQPQRSYKWEC
jgi:hypothetical protein